MKAGILEVVDLLVINKADMPGASKLRFDLGGETAKSGRVLETVAAENQGIEALLDRILALETGFRASDEFTQRRQRSLKQETVDWSLELLREQLSRLVQEQCCIGKDPRTAAEALLKRILHAPRR
jgi:LAO/AO transport system kinase